MPTVPPVLPSVPDRAAFPFLSRRPSRLLPRRGPAVVAALASLSLVATLPASADPAHDEHHHHPEDGPAPTGDPFVIEQDDLASMLELPAEGTVEIDGTPQFPAVLPHDLPAHEKYVVPAQEIDPSTDESLMRPDSGYFAYLAEQGEPVPNNAPAPPTRPGLPTQVDATPGWVFQYGISCDPNNKAGMLAFAELLESHYGRPTGSKARACQAGSTSMHQDGRAVDWPLNAYNAADKALGDSVAQWLTANDGEMAKRLGVQSIIWNHQAWWLTTRQWQHYDGHPHDDHIHFGFTWDGAMMRTSWWSGTAVTVPDHGVCRVYQGQWAPRYTGRNTTPCATDLPWPPPTNHPVLLPGAHHNSVKFAQQAMGFTGGDVDGSFGPQTLAALLTYQANTDVPVTGVLDNATWHRMESGEAPPDPRLIPVERVSGADRFAVAAQLARTFPTGGDLYVASGDTYPDALSASARAGTINSPVLLVRHDRIPLATRTALTRANPSRIIVVGGTETINSTVATQLRAYASSGTVVRHAGPDRYATAAEHSRAWGTNVPVVYVANGSTFPDGLAGSARAAHMNGPVLLTQATNVPGSTRAAMIRLKPARVVVLGGTTSVSNAVANELAGLTTTGNLQRVGGADRYAMAAALAAYYPSGLDTVYVATGETYQDALAAAARAGADGAPVVLVRKNTVPTATREVLRDLRPKNIVVVGGPDTISSSVLQQLARVRI